MPEPVTLAIAADAAFHFRYPEATELLEAMGVELRPWQPLADAPLPPDCQGVILPGGYPELHAPELAAARRSLADLRRAAAAGLPIYAECGGLLLLGQALEDPQGQAYPMAGLLPFTARRGALQLGYRQATPSHDGLVARCGEPVCGHEFHRWELHPTPTAPTALNAASALNPAIAPGAASCMSASNGVMDGIQQLWQLEGWVAHRGAKDGRRARFTPPGFTSTGLGVRRSAGASTPQPGRQLHSPWQRQPP